MQIHTLLRSGGATCVACLALGLAPAGAAGNDIGLAYRVVAAAGSSDLYLALNDGSGEQTFFLTHCQQVWPASITTNAVLDDLECDGVAVTVSIAREGIRVDHGADSFTMIELAHGRHVINGIPALIDGGETLQQPLRDQHG